MYYTLEERVSRLEHENKKLRSEVNNLKSTVLEMLKPAAPEKRQK